MLFYQMRKFPKRCIIWTRNCTRQKLTKKPFMTGFLIEDFVFVWSRFRSRLFDLVFKLLVIGLRRRDSKTPAHATL